MWDENNYTIEYTQEGWVITFVCPTNSINPFTVTLPTRLKREEALRQAKLELSYNKE